MAYWCLDNLWNDLTFQFKLMMTCRRASVFEDLPLYHSTLGGALLR
jgi:hypothetical protein